MLGKSNFLSAMEQNLKIEGISAALQQTGVPKAQADLAARQQVIGVVPPPPRTQAPMFWGFDMTTLLWIGGAILIGGIAYFAITKRSQNVHRRR